MRYTVLFSILILFTTSCTKDKFSSTPSLKFKSVNTTELHNQQLLTFTLSFTDAEGDLTDSVFVQEVIANCPTGNFSELYALPSFPTSKNQKGDLAINFQYNGSSGYTSISPLCQESDTAVFRFALKDHANHVSDTVSSPTIILVYP